MRILLIHQYFLEDHDGGGSRWNEMTKIWHQAGHEVSVIAGMGHYMSKRAHDDRSNFHRAVNKDGVEVIRCHVSRHYHVNFTGRLCSYFSFAFSSIWAGLWHIRGEFDMIIVTSPPLFVGLSGLVLSFLKRTPFVFEVRDLWPESAIDMSILTNPILIHMAYRFEKLIYHRARLVNVLTPAFREQLVSVKRVPSNKIIYIPNAADFSLVNEISAGFDPMKFRKENGFENRFVAVYVGAHGIANHLVQLLEAAQLLLATSFQLILIGDGMQKNTLKEYARRENLHNVQFIDTLPKKKVFEYILAADIGVSVLKKVDTFKTIYSNKTFDYFSCKKPVLLAIDGASRQLIEESDAGMFVEPENAQQIANGILHYMSRPEKVKLQGENGYRYALQHFDRNKLALQFIDELDKILKHQYSF